MGTALASLKDGEAAYLAAKKAGNAYDRAPPSSLGQLHMRFDDALSRVLYDTQRRVERDNSVAYFQPVPAAAAPLPQEKRLAVAEEFVAPAKSKPATE